VFENVEKIIFDKKESENRVKMTFLDDFLGKGRKAHEGASTSWSFRRHLKNQNTPSSGHKRISLNPVTVPVTYALI